MADLTTIEWEARIGAQSRAVRIAAGLTQAELARSASISETSVRSLERGTGSTLATLIAVLRVLDREEWLDQLDPRGTGPSPIELLRQSRNQTPRPQRVRRTNS
jgi:transcriptional regulator with XRE-family HTH domain